VEPSSAVGSRLGLVTLDDDLARSVRDGAAKLGWSLEHARSPEDAARLVKATTYDAKVIDYAATALLPAAFRNAHLILGGQPDSLVLLYGGKKLEGSSAKQKRVVFAQGAVDLLMAELARVLPEARERDAADVLLGNSNEIRTVREQIRHLARFGDVPVLILGETGTGKELAAEAIHQLSGSTTPMMAVNCAAIPENLVESELFGHEAGSYTGAKVARTGLLEAAMDGTMFFDEVGEMPLVLQPKLLRALEQRKFRRIGSNKDIALRARIVSATNRSLDGGSLRADIRFRLAGFTIRLPPLRGRAGDLEILASSFLRQFADRHALGPVWFTGPAMTRLYSHTWPGNVRELRQVVHHAAIVAMGEAIGEEAVAAALAQSEPPISEIEPSSAMVSDAVIRVPRPASPGIASATPLRDVEREVVMDAWREAGGNISKASKHLGIARSTLRERLRKYGAR
jgi:two-component system nitrogen regulation response regulator NtrX